MTITIAGPTWQQAMKAAIRDSGELKRRLGITDADGVPSENSNQGERQFPVFVPLEFLSRMRPGDADDPLLLQVLPRAQESESTIGFSRDPVGDSAVEVAPGLLHKYEGRVLFILSGACAIHCRYCFRRHYPYGTAPKSIEQWLPALEYIRRDPSIHEVILSGGDPLTVADQQLSALVRMLDEIPHLSRLRIHTRLPVVIPQRVDDQMCTWLSESRLSKWLVLHMNHANELDDALKQAIRRVQKTGTVVLNQSVLLNGINDSVDTLQELCNALIDCGVLPYYLHQLDRVVGASHFEVEPDKGIALIAELASRLPGYGVPKYVSEIAGEPCKTPVVGGVESSVV